MNNLSVKITADIVDLQTKFAVARAEYNGLTSEMNKLAKASANGGLDSAGTAKLQQLAGDVLHARSAMSGYSAELAKAGFAMNSFASSTEAGHGSIATATREFRALFDELSSGRTRQTPGTLAILATRVFGLGPVALGAVAGVGALAGGLGYLAYRAISASNAIDEIKIGANFAGNADISRRQIEQFADEMAKAGNISSSESRAIAGSFASMHDISAAQFHALSAVVSDFAQVTGQESTKAAEELAKMFGAKTSATQFARDLGGVTQQQLNLAESADKSGEANVVFAAKLDALNAALNRARPAIDAHNASIFASFKNYLAYSGMVQSGMTVEQSQTALIEDQNQKREKQVELLRRLTEQNFAAAQNPESTLKVGVATAESENPVSKQIDQAKAKIAEMNSALEVAQQRGDQIDISKLNAGLEKARETLSELELGPVVSRMHQQMEEISAAWDGTQVGMLQRQRQVAQQSLTETRAGTAQYIQIRSEEARIDVELKKARLDAEREVTQAAAQEGQKRLDYIRDQLAQSDEYLTEEARGAEELFGNWTEEYARITSSHAEMLKQQAADTARNAKEEISQWKGVVNEIEGAESGLVNNILSRRKGLSQSLIQLSGQIVEKEISDDLRATTTRIAFANSAEAGKKAAEQGGFLYHELMELRKTAVTHAQQTAQTAATTAGNTTRNAATASADAAAQAQAAVAGEATIQSDAAKTFAGVYSSVAQIPYVGWIMAPEAAAAAMAEVEAMSGMAALATGTNYVPHDMIAQIHEGEAVVPKRYNPAARGGSASGGPTYSEEHNYGPTHISALDTRDVKRALMQNKSGVIAAGIRAYRRGAR